MPQWVDVTGQHMRGPEEHAMLRLSYATWYLIIGHAH